VSLWYRLFTESCRRVEVAASRTDLSTLRGIAAGSGNERADDDPMERLHVFMAQEYGIGEFASTPGRRRSG
jgi:hypothetical protein